MRVTSIAPSIDCREIEIACRGVGLWKAPRHQVSQRGLKVSECLPQPARCGIGGDISRVNSEFS